MDNNKLSVKEKIGYGMGDAGCNIIFGAIMLFVNYFYTDIFGLAPALVGVLLLSVRVIDAVTDPIMGAIADRTRSKYGRFRPWLLWIAFPYALFSILMFTTPDWSYNSKVIYAFVTYFLLSLTGTWTEKGQVKTPFDTFALDATTFVHQGKRWYLWAQKAPDISGNSNLYLCEMENPWTLKGEPVMLSKPEYDWECRGFWVNEGPAVLFHGDKLFISYSASATDENYCMGLLWTEINADPQNPANWHKASRPVFVTSYENRQYGPGHNSFTQTPEGEDVLVYHARNYTEIEGDPLYDPNRHTRLKLVRWHENGMPDFGIPPADTP
ncbi:TPA: family 43 glycosylhydrolase [Enterobacter cloacae]|nr:family 43 glycosylhydrolase [Enterobacter cloacae]MCF2227745.1 family 43 glycosylhydrolase [Enterobacter cloacae]MDV5403939.1 family 43 glycosylhydrolase [Enterobacter cloacae]